MGITASIVGAVAAAGASVYSANKAAKSQEAALKHQKEREATADATRTQEKKLPRAPISGLDPAKIGAGMGGGTGGALSGVLLGSGTPGTYAAPSSTALLGGGP